jgi:hypothetical protein
MLHSRRMLAEPEWRTLRRIHPFLERLLYNWYLSRKISYA